MGFSSLGIQRSALGISSFVILVLASIAHGDELAVKDLRIGFQGRYKIGHWTPIWITLGGGESAAKGQLEIGVLDGDGVQANFVDGANDSVEMPVGAEVTALRYIKIGRPHTKVTVRLRSPQEQGRAGEVLCERLFSAKDVGAADPATSDFILTYGNKIGIEAVVRYRQRRTANREMAGGTLGTNKADHLPDQWIGYEGIDTLAISTSDASSIERLSSDQLQAIEDWVHQGGRLLLCVGRNGEQLVGEGKPLAVFAPGKLDFVQALKKTIDLETYANAGQSPLDKMEGAGQLMFTSLKDVRGVIETNEKNVAGGQGPTIVRFPFGFGQVIFIAMDLDVEPLSNWPGRSRMISHVLFGRERLKATSGFNEEAGQVTHEGFADLTGQLRGAMDQFQGVTLVSFTVVATLVLFYILLIGPGDYLLLTRFLPRMEWTWVTFPATVVSFCVLAYLLVGICKGTRLQINQVELVEIDAESSVVRGTMWAHVYSPRTQTYDFTFQPATDLGIESSGELLSWHGLAGTGLGGMNNQSTGELFSQPYAIAADDAANSGAALSDLPIQISSSKTLRARWWGTFTEPIQSRLSVARKYAKLHGEFTNPLDLELSDCVLTYGKYAYQLKGKLQPGATIRVDEQMREKSLNMHLTRRSLENVSKPWTRISADVSRIIEMMMFHEAAGGQSYTKLNHQYQDFTDLSGHLEYDVAFLTGWTDQQTGTLQQASDTDVDDGRSWTFYRIMLPVQTGQGGGV